ncbi:UNVERIFIED_CONTAM: hypothetical protein GTU68_052114 [Idotea baltica]|nr:hypothetical protein [Idotea baltica]
MRVVLFDRNQVGKESSWAGGGIVSPLFPWRYSSAVSALSHESQSFYPNLIEQLLAETNIDAQLHKTGLFWLDLDDQKEALDWAFQFRKEIFPVSVDQVLNLEPGLGLPFSQAIYMPDAANVRNPLLIKALRKALEQKANVKIKEHCAVVRLLQESNKITGVLTSDGKYTADKVVLSAGAWSQSLLMTLGRSIPIEPMKGQMILYKCDSGFLSHMVLANGRYVLPRKDGYILVGSTLERVGFDTIPTQKACEQLEVFAETLIPALRGKPLKAHWAGVRPGSPDGVPIIGEMPDINGLWLNCGHYRNGVVLAPASCNLLVDLMLKRSPKINHHLYAVT